MGTLKEALVVCRTWCALAAKSLRELIPRGWQSTDSLTFEDLTCERTARQNNHATSCLRRASECVRNRQQERLLARCTCLGNSAQAVGAGTHLQDAPKGAWFSLWSALALRDRERYGAPDFGRPASHAVRQSNS
ncbi:TPA: hypothetical protein ACH3X3_15239 [Trebouxia sp. C0006]